MWGSPDRGPAKNLDQDILRKQAVGISHHRHQHTAGGPQATQADRLTHKRHLPEKSCGERWHEGGKKKMFITQGSLQDERNWKMGRWQWEATEMPETLRAGLKRARCSFQHIPPPDHHDGGYCTDQHWHFVLLPFHTSLPRNLPWKVFPKNPGSLEVLESEPWHQQFLTKAIFQFKPRRMEVFKHLFAIHLPHSLHSRLSS